MLRPGNIKSPWDAWRRKACGLMMFGLIVIGSESAMAQSFQIQAKSFIAAVDLNDPSQFDSASACTETFSALVVDCVLLGGENPPDGELESGQFRLWSQISIDAQCNGDKVTQWNVSGVTTSFGKEGPFQTSGDVSKPLSVDPAPGSVSMTAGVTFDYRVRGQPISSANAVLAAARPRTCTYIWHEVQGTLSCANGTATVNAELSGSGFPSHRLWINGNKVSDAPQGPFKLLWVCDPIDPTSVQ